VSVFLRFFQYAAYLMTVTWFVFISILHLFIFCITIKYIYNFKCIFKYWHNLKQNLLCH
jgi:hypothetical protein